ncbi:MULTISPECIES: hypothetical protein [Chryseobacterium]|uniref:Lipoprotein n=1 Tax=Chryseobacterium camelliae TaxID=1265445 RepID=A0ABU0TI37_9FLAO|nr:MULTISPECIES: hypothetical protein [Chryseobacterium]MDT3409416.1 hypothetical protein [Pseudacidovorax intermedius]MDQ1096719.1 hypothetical protein [Chryseobacterium camelliae]MDQ1100663.1 hypothetical protein [Chryseobacterium sp. SORGH_AS_1048]MDR6088001.1 hypothetical protein [Chryseobacterium sp. SORGH_AS_0909]MDR6132376.1 hypothetical protein [Chryseobacterium sp. SORGH_AS_1175]
MKKTLFAFSAIFLLSCNGNDDLTNPTSSNINEQNSAKPEMYSNQSQNKIGEDIDLLNISDLSKPVTSESTNFPSLQFTKRIDFGRKDKRTAILTGVDQDGKIFYSTQNDGVVDFIVKPVVSNDYSDVWYLDGDGNKMYRLKLALNKDKTGVTIVFVESYTNGPEGIVAGRQKWSQCFSSNAGSALGVTGAVVSGFTGPWGVAGWYAGIAAYCALV